MTFEDMENDTTNSYTGTHFEQHVIFRATVSNKSDIISIDSPNGS